MASQLRPQVCVVCTSGLAGMESLAHQFLATDFLFITLAQVIFPVTVITLL